jgi:hypothetical protein
MSGGLGAFYTPSKTFGPHPFTGGKKKKKKRKERFNMYLTP